MTPPPPPPKADLPPKNLNKKHFYKKKNKKIFFLTCPKYIILSAVLLIDIHIPYGMSYILQSLNLII